MIQELKASHDWRCAFVAAPNRPMTRLELLSAYGRIAAVSPALATCFWFRGLPPALPFPGLESPAPAQGAALCVISRRGARAVIAVMAVIAVTAAVRTAPGRARAERRQGFQRRWTRVALRRSRIARRPGRLALRTHGPAAMLSEAMHRYA